MARQEMFASSTTRRSCRAGRLTGPLWGGAMLFVMGGALLSGVPAGQSAVMGALCLTPIFLDLMLHRHLGREWAQVAMTCVWTALALGAAFTLGATSGAALWFLLPVTAAFTFGRRSLVLETGVSSLLALILAVGLEAAGLAPPFYPAAQHKLLSALVAGAALVMVIAAFADVAGRMAQANATLRRRAQPGQILPDGAPGVLLRLDRSGRVLMASGDVESMLGADRDVLAGASAPALLCADAATGEALAATLGNLAGASGRGVILCETPAGRLLEAHAQGQADGVVLLALDVTAQRVRERELTQERDAAILASEAKSRFLAGMSHEIRTPLNAIIGFSDVMKQRMFGPVPARYAEYADMIHESGLHLLDLVGDVLDMSKIEADRYELKLEQMDARDVVAASVRLMRLRAEEAGVRLRFDGGHAPLPVHADRKALRQIMLNLLSNAVKFSPRDSEVRVALRADGAELTLEVADSGPGMTAEEVRRIGEPYRQAASAESAQERGSGLGLSLVAALARLHGGVFEIDSVPGHGATVRVRMPVIEAPAPVRMDDARARLQRAEQAGEEIIRAKAEA